ncbi:DUF4126 domain-containing protein [Sphingomonas nostoxanthinifaciens]|uniref:DUF4126 domain-containing protein n=1 Tax=Sphingomonas nostoxanthinifaciens TaxID=2872652 RepID=UPI001CC21971|nr:DUF4126 domain-containing protein [Sphingomonas nostoxanthinifaciens]UAK23342.1 DUF4126 domain-containing protein [Sphingomonas nostoxanthinifaciens]
MIYILALSIGVIAGLRAMMAPAAISWAACCALLPLGGSWLAFLGYRFTPWVLTIAALGELVTDQLPSTPSRKVPPQFGARLVSGGLCGAALGIPAGQWIAGLVLGLVGAVIGTLGGAAARGALARAFGSDRPAAFIEDAVAIAGAYAIVRLVA